jgi:hypothetical protein
MLSELLRWWADPVAVLSVIGGVIVLHWLDSEYSSSTSPTPRRHTDEASAGSKGGLCEVAQGDAAPKDAAVVESARAEKKRAPQ